jgi:hypothetical protein
MTWTHGLSSTWSPGQVKQHYTDLLIAFYTQSIPARWY